MKFNMQINEGDVTAKFDDTNFYQDYQYVDASPNIILSWRDIGRMVDTIYDQVKNGGYTAIVGLARGGLVPAVMLSHRLDIKFESVTWQTRDGGLQEVGRLNNIIAREDKVLIIDDICDSGLTLTQVKANHPDADVAVLTSKLDTKLVDFVAQTYYNDDRWVIFPWE
jgi:hypoxanthine phosphoribosyltransferase